MICPLTCFVILNILLLPGHFISTHPYLLASRLFFLSNTTKSGKPAAPCNHMDNFVFLLTLTSLKEIFSPLFVPRIISARREYNSHSTIQFCIIASSISSLNVSYLSANTFFSCSVNSITLSPLYLLFYICAINTTIFDLQNLPSVAPYYHFQPECHLRRQHSSQNRIIIFTGYFISANIKFHNIFSFY